MKYALQIVLSVLLLLSSPVFAAATQSITLGKDTRRDLVIAVYNNDFAVVKDIREVELPRGLVELEYQDIPAGIEPSSIIVGGDLDLIEQNYRYDLLSKGTLLERYIGRQIKYSRTLVTDDGIETIVRDGTLLSIGPEIVKFGNEIEIAPEGTISLPALPEGMTTEPTLVWLLENSRKGSRSVETTYITGGMSWQADHTLLLNEEGVLDLTTWVSLENNSGASYEDATLKLIAGQVSRVEDSITMRAMPESAHRSMAQADIPAQVFHEYQLYSMPKKTNIRDRESKQLHLLSATGVEYEKRYRLESSVQTGQRAGIDEHRFDVRIVFPNVEDNNLGMPLPGGKIRVYESMTDGSSGLAGENRIPHTPAGEEVSVMTGKAFDLIAERSQSSFRRVGENAIDVGYKIEVTNRKSERVSVTVREHVFGDWTILQQSHKGERVDSGTLDFKLDVEPGSKETLSYLVRVTR